MRFEYEGMSLWYGTVDAPAPEGTIGTSAELTITVGVQPWNAGNNVEVLYRINQGPTEHIAARWLRNDSHKKSQYFRAYFPTFRVGDIVEYIALCRRAGRQVVPPSVQTEHFASSFHVIGAGAKQEHGGASEPQAMALGPRGTVLPYLRTVNGGNVDGGSPGDGGRGQANQLIETGITTCEKLFAQRSILQTRLQHAHTDTDRQAVLDQISDVNTQIETQGCEKPAQPKPNPPACEKLFAQRSILQTRLQHAHTDTDRQAVLDQISDVNTQIETLGCKETIPPPQPPQPPQLFPEVSYQFSECLEQLKKQFPSLANIDLVGKVNEALQDPVQKLQKDYPGLVNQPIFVTDCVQQRERGGLWLAPSEKEDALKTHLSYIGDLFKRGDGRLFALQIAGFALHHLAQIVWDKQEKSVVSTETIFIAPNTPLFVGQLTSYQLSLVPPNQIDLQFTARGHSVLSEFVPGGGAVEEVTDWTATFTFTLKADPVSGQLKSEMTANDVNANLVKGRVPDIGQYIVSLFPTVICLPGKDDKQQAYKLVFLYDNLQMNEEEGIVVVSRQPPILSDDPKKNFVQVRQPSVSLGGNRFIPWALGDSTLNDPQFPGFIKYRINAQTVDLRSDMLSPLQVTWEITGDLPGKALTSELNTFILFGPGFDMTFVNNGGIYQEAVRVTVTDADGLQASVTIHTPIILRPPSPPPGPPEPLPEPMTP